MKNRFIVSILEALERIGDQRPAMGRPEIQARLSTIDNMAWQLLDDIKSLNSPERTHHLSSIERN
jgi:hypothetical protein